MNARSLTYVNIRYIRFCLYQRKWGTNFMFQKNWFWKFKKFGKHLNIFCRFYKNFMLKNPPFLCNFPFSPTTLFLEKIFHFHPYCQVLETRSPLWKEGVLELWVYLIESPQICSNIAQLYKIKVFQTKWNQETLLQFFESIGKRVFFFCSISKEFETLTQNQIVSYDLLWFTKFGRFYKKSRISQNQWRDTPKFRKLRKAIW